MHLFVSPYIYVVLPLYIYIYIHPKKNNDKLQAFFYFLALINFPLRIYLVVFSSGSQLWWGDLVTVGWSRLARYGCLVLCLLPWELGEYQRMVPWHADETEREREIHLKGDGVLMVVSACGIKNLRVGLEGGKVLTELVGLKRGGGFRGHFFSLFQWIIIFFGGGGGAFYWSGTHFVWGGGQSKFLAAKCW